MNPVYNIFGFKMRLHWMEAHHLYWGILGALVSWSGVVSSTALYWLLEGNTLQIIASGLIMLQFIAMYIWIYVALDDIYQHHRQVKEPQYHSPVHLWYVGYFYVDNSMIARAVRKIADFIDRKR